MAESSADVVIVGGGLAGMTTAYYLAKSGVPSVVVERDAIGSHASGFAYGGLSPLSGFGIPGLLAEMAQEGMRLHRELSKSLLEETGIDVDFRVRSSLALAFTEADVRRLRAALLWQQEQPGYTVRWLDVAEARRVEPRISDETLGATLIEGGGAVEPYRLVLALTRAAERLGVRVRHGRAIGLRRDGGRVTGVVLERELLSCAAAVLALGPWSAEASDWIGVPIEVRRLGPQLRHDQDRRPLVGGDRRGRGRVRRGVDARRPRRDRRCAPEDVAGDGGRAGRAADRLPASGGIRRAPRARLCARARSGLRGHGRRSQGHPLRSRDGAGDRRSRPRSGHAGRTRRFCTRPLRRRSRSAAARRQGASSMARLNGKVAVVTGGASGIGEATVRRFVTEGAKVAFADRDVERGKRVAAEITASGGQVVFVEAHMEREVEAAAFVRQAAQRLGRLDILVNNAGVRLYHTVEEASSESWDEILAVNLKGYAFCAKAAIPLLRHAGGGSIVNVASVRSVTSIGKTTQYDTTKAAVAGLTCGMAADHAADSIRVNAVCPGPIYTPFHEKRIQALGRTFEQYREDAAKSTLLRRPGTPEEVAACILFLASDDASYVTGSLLFVDGGYTAM